MRSLIVIATLLFSLPTYADDSFLSRFEPDLSLRSRYEFVDWFQPADTAVDNDYAYAHTKLQFGARYKSEQVKAFVQGQYFQLYDLPEHGIGPGDSYFKTNGLDHSPGDVILRQAYLAFSGPTLESTSFDWLVGRAFYSNGGEVITDNKELESIKQQRIYNRVLGTFDFTAGRSFDSVRGTAHWNDTGHFTGSYMRPTQGGFATDGSEEMDINLATAALTTDPDAYPGIGEAQLFYYFYGDTRDDSVVKTDNRAAEVRAADTENIAISNIGFHWIQIIPEDDVSFNTLVWAIAQVGDWGNQDHEAAAFALEAEAKLNSLPLKPSIRVGYNWGSGDSDPNDGDHETFFVMLPTVRQYAQTPFFNMMNNEDIFGRLTLTATDKIKIGGDFHYLRLQNGRDLFYSGGGANKDRDQFGINGSLADGSEEIGYLFDVSVSYNITAYLTGSVYYGHLAGGDVPDALFADGDINYGYVELTAKLP